MKVKVFKSVVYFTIAAEILMLAFALYVTYKVLFR